MLKVGSQLENKKKIKLFFPLENCAMFSGCQGNSKTDETGISFKLVFSYYALL